MPAGTPGPKMPTKQQRPHERVHRARRLRISFREQVDRRERARSCARRAHATGSASTGASSVPSGDVDRLDHRVVHRAGIVRPVDGPHARRGRPPAPGASYEELRDDLDGVDRGDDRGDDDEIDEEARELLPEREAPPCGRPARAWQWGGLRSARRGPTSHRRHVVTRDSVLRRGGRDRRASRCR